MHELEAGKPKDSTNGVAVNAHRVGEISHNIY